MSTASYAAGTDGDPIVPETFRLEHRSDDRWPLDGAATAFRLGGERFGELHSLRMLDYSHHGMGAMSHLPIEPGAIVSVGFQTPGYIAKRGTVVNCSPSGEGYRVGILFEARLAA